MREWGQRLSTQKTNRDTYDQSKQLQDTKLREFMEKKTEEKMNSQVGEQDTDIPENLNWADFLLPFFAVLFLS